MASGYVYIWDARDHFYSSKSIRLEVLIFNNNDQYIYVYIDTRMDGHVFERRIVEQMKNNIKSWDYFNFIFTIINV